MRRCAKARGVTLIEMLVVAAVGVVVVGIITGILIQSDREADFEMRRGRLLSVASGALQSTSRWCERARGVEVSAGEAYEPGQIRLNSRGAESAEPGVWELRSGGEKPPMWRWQAGDWHSPAEDKGEWIPLSTEQAVRLNVTFRYAWEFNGLEPAWNPESPGSGRPRVLEITVLAQDDLSRVKSVRLSTVLSMSAD